MNRPTKATRAGQTFLALRGEANSAGRATAEYLRLYALEGFLLRLAASPHRDRFVLKGGVLLAAYDLRRPTADVDLAALATPNEVEPVRNLVAAIAATPLPADSDDGLTFALTDVRAETIREGDQYSGVRVRLVATLATAREPFHVDVNIGDRSGPARSRSPCPDCWRRTRSTCAVTPWKWSSPRRSSRHSSAARRVPGGATSATSTRSPDAVPSAQATSAAPCRQ